MANQLQMAKVSSIQALHELGWSFRRISQDLSIHRETVSRYVRLGRDSKPAKQAPPGSMGKPAKQTPLGSEHPITGEAASATTPVVSSRAGGVPSQCEPWREQILSKLERGLTAKRIYQDLLEQGSDAPSYYSVRRFVFGHNKTSVLPFRRMECEPGMECQVDFGKGAPVTQPNGRRRRPHLFRIVLSCSRKGYSETVWRQTTENFIRCLENAFWHFGGVPQTLVLDNLRAAVSKADWFDPQINPKVQSFCDHYGIVPLPTKPYTPRHKGKIERGIGYAQDNGLKGRVFDSVEAQNRHLLQWETTVADTRIHGTTRKQVGQQFEQIERSVLTPLPQTRFAFFHEGLRTVHRDGHVEVAKAYYSVPPEYLRHQLWVRWDGRVVRIFDQQMKQIAIHVQHEPGRFSTQSEHIASQKISAVERGASWLLGKVGWIGTHAQRWAEAMVQERGIQGVRVLQGLLSLAERHEPDLINQACEIALSHRAFRLQTIRQLIKRQAPKQNTFDFIQEHPIIRSLDEYQQLVHRSFTQECSI